MEIIIATTVVITLIGIVVGIGLVLTSKKFAVEQDEKEIAVRECLPGNNCGACGLAGCDACAAAIVKGEVPINVCPVGGQPVTDKIGLIMGTTAVAEERKVAFVRCKGSCEVTKNQGNYIGVKDCRSAVLSGVSISDCDYGCLGFGTCQSVCPVKAIRVIDNVAVVNPSKCISCGMCVRSCPRNLIELVPISKTTRVQCSNRDTGLNVKRICKAGCIGCGICSKQCEFEAITLDNNLAHVNYKNCTLCGKCAEKCPVKVIIPPEKTPVSEADLEKEVETVEA
ncbi:MAG: RnfABCDGE type electron transport complex subunit B [Eubacteriaceae bacterium]|nr:RnfABCDGE type electron transport complex subunit B [Eubacteriaceae bacterium]